MFCGVSTHVAIIGVVLFVAGAIGHAANVDKSPD